MRFNIHVIEVSEGDNVWKYTHTKKNVLDENYESSDSERTKL